MRESAEITGNCRQSQKVEPTSLLFKYLRALLHRIPFASLVYTVHRAGERGPGSVLTGAVSKGIGAPLVIFIFLSYRTYWTRLRDSNKKLAKVPVQWINAVFHLAKFQCQEVQSII